MVALATYLLLQQKPAPPFDAIISEVRREMSWHLDGRPAPYDLRQTIDLPVWTVFGNSGYMVGGRSRGVRLRPGWYVVRVPFRYADNDYPAVAVRSSTGVRWDSGNFFPDPYDRTKGNYYCIVDADAPGGRGRYEVGYATGKWKLAGKKPAAGGRATGKPFTMRPVPVEYLPQARLMDAAERSLWRGFFINVPPTKDSTGSSFVAVDAKDERYGSIFKYPVQGGGLYWFRLPDPEAKVTEFLFLQRPYVWRPIGVLPR